MGHNHVIGEVYRQFERGSVTLKRFPDLPYGLLITDKKGDSVIFYWDGVRQKVKKVLPDKAANRVPSNSG